MMRFLTSEPLRFGWLMGPSPTHFLPGGRPSIRQRCEYPRDALRRPPELRDTFGRGNVVNSMEEAGEALAIQNRRERPPLPNAGAIDMIRQVQSPFELANIEPAASI